MTSYLYYDSVHQRTGATITASSSNVGYPVTNISTELSTTKEWRSANTVTTATLVIDAGTAVTADSLLISGNNVTRNCPFSSITLEANSSNSWGAPPFTSTTTDINTAEVMLIHSFVQQSYRYWRISVTYTSGYCGLSALFLGNKMEIAPSFGWSFGRVHGDVVIEGQYGRHYYQRRNYRKILSGQCSSLNKAEMEALELLSKTCGNVLPVWICMDSAEAISTNRELLATYGRLMAPLSFANDAYGLWSTQLDIAEIV